MKIKSFLATTAMLLSLAAIGSARTWDITVDSNTKAGSVMLPAGSYTVKVDNNQAQFIAENGKKFTVPVKIENSAATKKFGQTEMKTEKAADGNKIVSIDLGGTTQELQFGE